jgi:chromate transporter
LTTHPATRSSSSSPRRDSPGLGAVLREWGRIGCIGFGGPPTHIAMLRDLCVERRRWIAPGDFEDAVAALQPAPRAGVDADGDLLRVAARRPAGGARGRRGLHRAGARRHPRAGGPLPVRIAAAVGPRRRCRAGAAVAAVAVHAGASLVPASWQRAATASRARWALYFVAGAAAAATLGPWLVLVLLASGAIELTAQRRPAVAAAFARTRRRWSAAAGCSRSPGWRSRSARSPTAGAS